MVGLGGKNKLCFSTFFYVVAINANQSTFAGAKVQQILVTVKFRITFDFIL